MLAELTLLALLANERYPMDAPVPPPPEAPLTFRAGRTPGTPTIVFVNFDGIELGKCNPSNSKRNCHWYNDGRKFEAFSGSLQTKLSILQAMRSDVADFGIRVTGQRPSSSEDYTMVVYGGTEDEFDALGSAPSGDCGDVYPNDIAFAHLDGGLNTWVNGGATTALHEAAHTWGLDHVDLENSIMFPSGDNSPVSFHGRCERVVGNTDLKPGDASCPELNEQQCGDPNRQNAYAMLTHLFGPSYVDQLAPRLTLRSPKNGAYFQVPATLDVEIDIEDDLHPQVYSLWLWIGDEPPPERPTKAASAGFRLANLPVGEWLIHVRVADEAGNETQLDFELVVGEDPPPDEEGCACQTGARQTPRALVLLPLVGLLCRRRRRRALG